MINAIIFPVLFILLIIVLLNLRRNMHKIMKPHLRGRWLIGYLTLLVVLTIVFFIVQPQVIIPEQEVESAPMIYEVIYESDDFSSLESYKVNEWDILIEEENLRMQVMYTSHWVDAYIPVVVIEDETLVDRAHLVHYETTSSLNGIDISEYVPMPEIDVLDGHVVAKISEQFYAEHEFRSIQNDAILRQFTERSDESSFFDMTTGELALVVTVPKGTTLTADVNQFDLIRQ